MVWRGIRRQSEERARGQVSIRTPEEKAPSTPRRLYLLGWLIGGSGPGVSRRDFDPHTSRRCANQSSTTHDSERKEGTGAGLQERFFVPPPDDYSARRKFEGQVYSLCVYFQEQPTFKNILAAYFQEQPTLCVRPQ